MSATRAFGCSFVPTAREKKAQGMFTSTTCESGKDEVSALREDAGHIIDGSAASMLQNKCPAGAANAASAQTAARLRYVAGVPTVCRAEAHVCCTHQARHREIKANE